MKKKSGQRRKQQPDVLSADTPAALSADAPAPALATLYMTQRNLARSLIQQGRADKALPLITQLVELSSRLADDRTGQYAEFTTIFRAGLANAHEVHASCLAGLHRFEEAIEADSKAIAIFRELERDDSGTYADDVAKMLGNRANHLVEVGRHAEALADSRQAIAVRRHLAETEPDTHTLGLAHNLTNYAVLLTGLGQHDQALEASKEAVEMLRPLIQEESDRRLLGTFAHALKAFAVALYDTGTFGAEAGFDEAIGFYRQLAADNPGRYLSDLGDALQRNAQCYIKHYGAREASLALVEPLVEALQIAELTGNTQLRVLVTAKLAMIEQVNDSYTFHALIREANHRLSNR